MTPTLIATSILGGCGLIITFVYNRANKRLAWDRLNKELFTEFNNRYDALNDYLYIITLQCASLDQLLQDTELKYKLNDYFNLCAEEYYWYKKGRIDKKVWISWQAGMRYWYNNYEIIRLAWEEELRSSGHESFYLKPGEKLFN